jgi:hypothetical protein
MLYVGITCNINIVDTACLKGTGLCYEHGIIYARKGADPQSLLIPAWELETIKGNIRRLPKEIYDNLNDDFGFHSKVKPRLILKNKSA